MWKYYTDPRSSNTLRIYQSSCRRHVRRGTETDCRDYLSGAPDWLCRRSDIDGAAELSAIKKGKRSVWVFNIPDVDYSDMKLKAVKVLPHLPLPLRGARLNEKDARSGRKPRPCSANRPAPGCRGAFALLPDFEGLTLEKSASATSSVFPATATLASAT